MGLQLVSGGATWVYWDGFRSGPKELLEKQGGTQQGLGP